MDETTDTDAQVIFTAEGGPEGARWTWLHLKRSAQTETALLRDPDTPDDLAEALLEHDTLPRVHSIEGRTLLFLRGINHTPGAEPEDMISLRLAITAERVTSIEIRRLRQIDRLIAACEEGRVPENPAAFVIGLVEALRSEVEPVLDELEHDLAALEKRMLRSGENLTKTERAKLIDTRQDAIQLHRYISPQGQALETLSRLKPDWLTDRRRLRAESHAFNRIAADLQAVRDRAQLVAEEASMAVNERTNRIILTLSAVSVVFLPITALTGLFGVNLAGIPYAEQPWAFVLFAGVLVCVGALAAWVAIRLLR